ncbi:MAG: response regulator transcription factor [Anaerolineae bacterium]
MTITTTTYTMTHILIVDDDALMRRGLGFDLEQANYRVSTAENAEDALVLAQRDRPDLVLLDIGLPGMDGLDALRHFRQSIGDMPVIFVTARRRDMDRIIGLELGADDYVTKPFNIDVLLARMKAVLRRTQLPVELRPISNPIEVGNIVIDPSAHTVMVSGRLVELTAREFDLLHALALRPGHVFSIDELLSVVWGAEFRGESQVVYVHIRRLRSKIEIDPDNPRHIITVRGVGYKLVPTGN